jgi:hypothetical protein
MLTGLDWTLTMCGVILALYGIPGGTLDTAWPDVFS